LRAKKQSSSSPTTHKKAGDEKKDKLNEQQQEDDKKAISTKEDLSSSNLAPESQDTKEQLVVPETQNLGQQPALQEDKEQAQPEEAKIEPIEVKDSPKREAQRAKRAKFERRLTESAVASDDRILSQTPEPQSNNAIPNVEKIEPTIASASIENGLNDKELKVGEKQIEQTIHEEPNQEAWEPAPEHQVGQSYQNQEQPQEEELTSSFSPSGTVAIQSLPEVQEFEVEITDQKQKKRGEKKKKRKKGKSPKKGEQEENAFKETGPKEKIAFSDRVIRFALKYTRFPTRIIAKRMPGLRENLLRSNMRISPEGVISLALLFTLISIPVSLFGAYELWIFGLRPWALFVPAVSIVPFFIGITLPKVSASSRAQALDNELPYLIAYITVLAGGGISPIVTLKRISKAGKIFPAAAKEAARILMDIEIFGLDAISALERATRFTPNKTFSDFIGGYVAVLKTGGDALSYLEAKLKEIFAVREAKVKSGSEFIATMSEAYIITTVVMGVSLMVLWATQNLMSPTGLPTTGGSVNSTLILMFSGLFVPVISLIFIIVIGSSQIREPFSYDRPFYIFLACMPVGALIYFLPLGLAPYYQLGIGLLVASGPPMIFQMMYKKRKEAVEAKLSNFLRDLSEVRKTGLAPEKTIEQLANRNYGALTVHVKKIAAQVSWGTPLKTVLQTFIKEVKSWVSRAVAFLLLEVVDVGGGSAKMFISLADFTEKNGQLEKERKSLIRPYIIIPYIGAILIVATTAMMVYYAGFSFQSFPGSSSLTANFIPSASVLTEATNTLLLAAFFQAWVMGFVAGKMGEGSAADGFKHATLLITISMVTVVVTSLFITI
jgi:flagellar protein FlaJ